MKYILVKMFNNSKIYFFFDDNNGVYATGGSMGDIFDKIETSDTSRFPSDNGIEYLKGVGYCILIESNTMNRIEFQDRIPEEFL